MKKSKFWPKKKLNALVKCVFFFIKYKGKIISIEMTNNYNDLFFIILCAPFFTHTHILFLCNKNQKININEVKPIMFSLISFFHIEIFSLFFVTFLKYLWNNFECEWNLWQN